jgi:hypothetical protein
MKFLVFKQLFKVGALCSRAEFEHLTTRVSLDKVQGKKLLIFLLIFLVIGDASETAILKLCQRVEDVAEVTN